MLRIAHRVTALAATAAVSLLAVAGAGCSLDLSLGAEARNTWNRDYTLADGGTLEITNPNGRVEVVVGEGDAVTVRAERIVKASTQEAADRALEAFAITEDASPARIRLDATVDNGITINLSRTVNYHVTVPKWANVTLTGGNGDIDVTGLEGKLEARLGNGRIIAKDFAGTAAVRTSNGAINLQLAKLPSDGLDCQTTNGAITLELPATMGADVSARVANGQISYDGLDLRVIEESRRRLDARLAGGGPELRLQTTNGAIRLRAR